MCTINYLLLNANFWAAISAICSCITIGIMCIQFKKNKEMNALPILNPSANIEYEEGELPDVIMNLNKQSFDNIKETLWKLEIKNIGLGLAKDVRIQYKDNCRIHTVLAYYDMILPNDYISYLMNIDISEKILDFELNIYFKDIYNTNYVQKMKGYYKICKDETYIHIYKSSASKKAIKFLVPKAEQRMRHEEESVAKFKFTDYVQY